MRVWLATLTINIDGWRLTGAQTCQTRERAREVVRFTRSQLLERGFPKFKLRVERETSNGAPEVP